MVETRLLERLERAVHRSRADPVQPAAPVLAARRGERGTRQLLGIQPVRNPLRRVAPLRQCARHRFGGELVAEAGLITVACDGGHEIAPRAPEGSSYLKPLSRRVRVWGEGPVSRWHSRSRRSLLLSLAASRCHRIAGFASLVLQGTCSGPHPLAIMSADPT